MSGSEVVRNFYAAYYAEKSRAEMSRAARYYATMSRLGDPELNEEVQKDLDRRFKAATEQLDKQDQQIIRLRHIEQLSNQEAAERLGIGEPAASMRYLRAVRRLRRILTDDADAGDVR